VSTITNRSNYLVSVPRSKDLPRSFAYNAQPAICAYVKQLSEQGIKPVIKQLEDKLQVRTRRIGHKNQLITFKSAAEADAHIKRIESEQTQGLFIDYTAAANVTFAELIQKYIIEECPALKGGGETTIYMLNALVEDSTGELKKRIALRKQEMKEFGKTITKLNANRLPMGCLEWMQLPLTQIKSTHIEEFIADRVQYVEPSSVDRQLDLMSAVFNRATASWGYHLEKSPMTGVRRPKYFNERDRRLQDDEEARLLDQARREDQLRSMELRVTELVAAELLSAAQLPTHYGRNEARKSAYEVARRKAISDGFAHIPFYETFIQFQLATAARRGEALGLFWTQVNFTKQTAYLPAPKNGKPRNLIVRQDILTQMTQLPRSSDQLFDIGLAELVNAWVRMCENAGIMDLHIHDLRHEGISRAAESGLFPSVIDLQAFSGHRDIRSLSRYSHLNSNVMAERLEQAEENRLQTLGHKGRERLKSSEMHWLGGSAPVASATPVLAKPEMTKTDSSAMATSKTDDIQSGKVVGLMRRAPRPVA